MEQRDSYHVFSKIIHWVTALLILGLLFLGFYMTSLSFSEDKLALYGWHKSFGLLVLALTSVRVLWHVTKHKPKPLETHKKWERVIARSAHIFLYFALFIMPLSGWIMSSAGDFAVKFFGLNVPDLVQKNESLFQNSRQVHEIIAFILLLIVGLHMAGALKHHFIDRDIILRRITTANLGGVGGVVLSVFVFSLYVFGAVYAVNHLKIKYLKSISVIDEAVRVSDHSDDISLMSSDLPEWHIDTDNSLIGFEVTQYGQGFQGHFKILRGQIFFDEMQMAQNKVRIDIDILSIKTGSDDRDAQAVSAEWFDVETFPNAVFEANIFEKISTNHFLARGKLTLRGVTMPIDLPFVLNIFPDANGKSIAKMVANLNLNRLDFGIGQGKWQSVDAIGGVIKIDISLIARNQ
ncbi:MAG: hypothetical protein COA45_09295 [Zetaproteobacteria bacterium]|nr:MAG: hypothetical protein COA45_09295 [Zetaproteobacteria bacterium]